MNDFDSQYNPQPSQPDTQYPQPPSAPTETTPTEAVPPQTTYPPENSAANSQQNAPPYYSPDPTGFVPTQYPVTSHSTPSPYYPSPLIQPNAPTTGYQPGTAWTSPPPTPIPTAAPSTPPTPLPVEEQKGEYQWTSPTKKVTEKKTDKKESTGGNPPSKPPKTKWPLIAIVLVVLVALGVVIGHFFSGTTGSNTAVNSTTQNSAISPTTGNALSGQDVYKKTSPSIVGIQVYSNSNHLSKSMIGEGSGIIASEDGYIITNAHVITGSNIKAILVLLSNGESYEATLLGQDTSMDLAALKIEAPDLVAAEFGDSDKLESGEICYAIGNPGGSDFANSISMGIISGLDRQLMDDDGFVVPSIQTTAAINPGNSGGALVNSSGQVIGVTSSKIALDYFESMGFAIPINDTLPIIDELIENGKILNRARIGITYSESTVIDEASAKVYGCPTGIQVSAVESGSDAAAQGLKAGDIIHSIDGETIASVKDMQAILRSHKAGDEVTAEIYRPTSSNSLSKGETISITFRLMEESDASETSSS